MPYKDKAKRNAAVYQYYATHPEAAARRRQQQKEIQKRRAKHNAELRASFKARRCADCGIQYPSYVMQFDHVRGTKEFTISERTDMREARVISEIAKCDVVCANCHSERTYTRKAAQLSPSLSEPASPLDQSRLLPTYIWC